MSHCARVARRNKGKQSCKYNKNNVVPLGNHRIHVVCLEEILEAADLTSGPLHLLLAERHQAHFQSGVGWVFVQVGNGWVFHWAEYGWDFDWFG